MRRTQHPSRCTIFTDEHPPIDAASTIAIRAFMCAPIGGPSGLPAINLGSRSESGHLGLRVRRNEPHRGRDEIPIGKRRAGTASATAPRHASPLRSGNARSGGAETAVATRFA